MEIATTGDLIRSMARDRGDRPAITYQDRGITYADLHDRSSRVGQGLAAEGVGPQDRVAFLDKNTPEHFEVLFGCAKLNAVIVPVNWRLAPAEMLHIINDSQAKVLFVGEEFYSHLHKIEGELQGTKKIIALGDHPRLERYDAWVGGRNAEDPQVPAEPDDVTIQMYTSGTTGFPKGAMITHNNLWSMVPISKEWGITGNSVSLVCMPLFHLAGTGWSLTCLYHGCHCVLLREPDPKTILEVIPRHDVTVTVFVPVLMQFLLQTPGVETTNFSSLDTIAYGASPIPEDVLVRAMETFGSKFVQMYGLTESSGFVSHLLPEYHDLRGPHPERLRSCGIAPAGIEVRIVDPETGEDKPRGEVGEIWVLSTGVMKGYWNQPEETARTITPEGWLRTGDAAYMDADGYLFLYDRVKDMIVSGGENIYPAEVENVLHSHPEVVDAGVIGVPDEKWGETVKGIVVRASGSSATAEDIVAFVRERLAHYKCPTSIDFADSLPRNASGKILKRELREPYWKGRERRVH